MTENKNYTPDQNNSAELPTPLLPDGQPDLTELARQWREGERSKNDGPITAEEMAGGHFRRMRPDDRAAPLDIGAIQQAWRESNETEARPADTNPDSRN